MDPNRVIGKNGKLPWVLYDDFKWFKLVTTGHELVMGRKTFESIGKPLPQRFTYVITNDKEKLNLPSKELFTYVPPMYIFQNYKMQPKDWWLCGGHHVYETFLPMCDAVYVTHVYETFEGDTYMPAFEDMFPRSTFIFKTDRFKVVKYEK